MRIRIKQGWGLLILSIVSVIYLFVFGSTFLEKNKDVVEIYFADRITAAHQKLIDKYNMLNEGKVKVIPIDFPNFDFSTNEKKEILTRSLRAKGDGIDLFAVDLIWVQRFAKWCEPLDTYFTEEEKNDFIPEAMTYARTKNGKLMSVPFNRGLGVLYYRKDLVEKYFPKEFISLLQKGITWKDFIKYSNSVKLSSPYYIFPASDFEGLVCVFVEALASINKDYFKTFGFNFKTKQAKQALQLLVDLVNKYKVSPSEVENLFDTPAFKYFIDNNALFIRGWISFEKDFAGSDLDYFVTNQMGRAPLPYFSNGAPATTIGGWDLMVSKFSNKKKETIDFIKFLLSEQSQETFFTASRYYPVRKSFYNEANLRKYPELIKFKKLLKSAVSRPVHIEYTRFSKTIAYYANLAISGKINVNEALEKMTAEIQLDRLMVDEFLE